jgi:hypothetical protein
LPINHFSPAVNHLSPGKNGLFGGKPGKFAEKPSKTRFFYPPAMRNCQKPALAGSSGLQGMSEDGLMGRYARPHPGLLPPREGETFPAPLNNWTLD